MRSLPDAVVILAGGAGRRLGGAAKPVLSVGGRPMLHRVLAAVAESTTRVVVGPAGLPLPAGVVQTREEPPGGGPVAALAAGLARVPASAVDLAVLAADLPLLTREAVARLRSAAVGYDGAVYLDGTGRPQWLCGVWRVAAVRRALTQEVSGGGADAADGEGAAARFAGVPLWRVLAGLRVRPVSAPTGPPVWWDCDTEDDLEAARRWADGGP
ncbi:MAG TPA: NTP transferase domain-containing protein [Natronosporangium sp.]|nr:NTP transferase domain-containing protein [Natronosporangium sp.]